MTRDEPRMTAEDFEALGVYDPADLHAARRLELLDYLVSLGATADDLLDYRNSLPGVATVVRSRAGDALTVGEAVHRSGISRSKLVRIIRAAGFAEPDPDERVISERFADLAGATASAEAIFGEQATLQLMRVMGSAMGRLADAAVSAFLVNVEPAARDGDPVGLRAAQASARAVDLVPAASAMLETLLRQHIIRARRTALGEARDGYETQRVCVGFVDLVRSTALAERVSTRELGSVLTEFEHTAADAITARGGRVVKLIGDAVMFAAADASAAVEIAAQLIALLGGHPSVPAVRAGVAGGDVLVRDGDVFGPVVNLAARAVKVAAPGEVVMPLALATTAGIEAEPLGRRQLHGFSDDVRLCRVKPRHGKASAAA